jgi:hypothetical protein
MTAIASAPREVQHAIAVALHGPSSLLARSRGSSSS